MNAIKLILLLPVLLSASTIAPERYDKWVLDVERALDSSEYCQELSLLVGMPEAYLEISEVLQEILKERCDNGNL